MLSRFLTVIAPVRAARRLRYTVVGVLSLWLLMPPGISTTARVAVAEGLPHATGRPADLTDGTTPKIDDEHKWFISVISMHNCGACERLKHDFAHAESLSAFVNANDDGASWSHYNVFHWEDPAHRQRWQSVGLTLFPTIVIQPPLSGQYGDPTTIVLKKVGYDGNDRQLAQDIRSAIKSYIAKLPDEKRARSRLAALSAQPQRSGREASPDRRDGDKASR